MTNACTAVMQQCFPDGQSWVGYSSLPSAMAVFAVSALCGNPLDLWNGRGNVLSKSSVRLMCLYLFPAPGRAVVTVQYLGDSEASTSCQFYFLYVQALEEEAESAPEGSPAQSQELLAHTILGHLLQKTRLSGCPFQGEVY